MHLQFVIWVDVGQEDAIPKGSNAKPSKTSWSENWSEPDCEWACHVPPKLRRRDVCIWTDIGPKPTHLLSLHRWWLSEAVNDRFIQKWLATGLPKSHGLPHSLFPLHLTFISPNLEVQTFLFCCCFRWMMWNTLRDTPRVKVASDGNLIQDVSQERFPCNSSVYSHIKSDSHSMFLHVLQTWSLFSCYSGVLGGSRCYFMETPAGLTTGWQHLLTVICSHAGCENSPACGKITHCQFCLAVLVTHP